MKKPIMIKYNKKEYVAGEQIRCDVCTKLIFDSRHDEKSHHYYKAMITESSVPGDHSFTMMNYDLCGTECARTIFDSYLEGTLKRGPLILNDMEIQEKVYVPKTDYTRIPEDVPIDQYKLLQREAD